MNKLYHVIILFLFFSLTVNAQYAEDAVEIMNDQYGFGSRAIGMGSAFTGVADDYSAIYWNPAGLAQLKRMEFYGGLSHLNLANSSQFYGTQYSADENHTKLSSLGFVFPVPTFRGSLVFAVGFQRVKEFDRVLSFTGYNPNSNGLSFLFLEDDQEVEYFFDKNVRQEEYVSQSGNLNNWSFAGAVDVSPNVSVGATLNFWTGEATYMRDFIQTDVNNLYPDPQGDPLRQMDFYRYSLSQKIIGDYSAFQLKLGALIHATESLRIGANISLPSIFNVVEKFNDRDRLSYDIGDQVDEFIYTYGEASEFEYDVITPFQFNFGASYQLGNFLITGAADFVDLSQVEFDLPDGVDLDENYSALLDENRRIKNEYEPQIKLKGGAEFLLPSQNLSFRAGYFYDPSPLKNAPEDFDRHLYSGGIGLVVDRQFNIDLTYIYGNWKNTSSASLTPGLVNEDITYQKIFLTTRFKF